ncbi:septum site-determining protein Ssd [Nocardia acidivorans]|uniref:septum site-determining protein Ssd n=1 Tax=Nocardia acidivorans TaxID=404580 RepID=UPI00083387DF|nr:septum site-determining protein Ssd [Nocardia acidivorans]
MKSSADPAPGLLALLTDPRLRDEVRRIAAAADRPLDERTPPIARHPWAAAPVIVLDTAAARCCVSAGAARRPGIILVTAGEPGLPDWQTATEIGAERVLALPAGADALIAAFTASDQAGSGGGAVLAIAGAGGGAGASTLAAAVALVASGGVRRGSSSARSPGAEPARREPLRSRAVRTAGGPDYPRSPNTVVREGSRSDDRAGRGGHAADSTVGGRDSRFAPPRGRPDAGTRSPGVLGRSDAERSRIHTLLVDADPFGGGIDLLLGLEHVAGLRWPDLVIEDGRVSAAALHDALPGIAGTAVLSCGRGSAATELTPSAMRAVVEAGRSAGDLVICDLSAERGPQTEEILDAADLVVLVVPARLRAIAAAESVAGYLARRNPHVRLLVRGPSPGGLRGREISETLALPLLAALPQQPGLAERLERGGLTIRRRGPLRTAADLVLTELSQGMPPRPSRIGARMAGAVS